MENKIGLSSSLSFILVVLKRTFTGKLACWLKPCVQSPSFLTCGRSSNELGKDCGEFEQRRFGKRDILAETGLRVSEGE